MNNKLITMYVLGILKVNFHILKDEGKCTKWKNWKLNFCKNSSSILTNNYVREFLIEFYLIFRSTLYLWCISLHPWKIWLFTYCMRKYGVLLNISCQNEWFIAIRFIYCHRRYLYVKVIKLITPHPTFPYQIRLTLWHIII